MTRSLVWCVAVLGAVAAVAVAATATARDETYQELDVHMKLNGAALQYIEGDLRQRIAAAAPHNEVNFTTTIPHITLYLTEYVGALLPDAVAALNTLVPRLAAQVGACNVTLGRPVVSGQYFMWNTEVPACLQQISDTIALELARFRNKNQEVPEWVYNLPEPDRTRRINLVRQYGSPGVFQFFNPQFVLFLPLSTNSLSCPHVSPHTTHSVTLAWSATDDMKPLLDLEYPTYSIPLQHIGFGVTGDHGTVLRDKDIASWKWK